VLALPLTVAAALLALLGIVGCVLPALPGPPISFVALLVFWGARGWQADSFGGLAVLGVGVAAVLVTLLDTVAPAIGARRYGASRWGVWGSVLGMIAGMIAFPPLGMIAGAFVGALAGELAGGQETRASLRASWGVFVYTMLGIVLKLAVSLAVVAMMIMELL
jgi:uncharacterized protein YqgC (DUF456 family)